MVCPSLSEFAVILCDWPDKFAGNDQIAGDWHTRGIPTEAQS